MIHVALVAPAPALRAGLRALLSGDESLQIVAEAAALAEAAPLPAEVDVLILALPEIATADLELALRSIEHGAVLFLVENPHEVTPLLDSPLRAWGALSWEASAEELQAAVHAVHQGLWVGSPQVFQPLLARGASVEASNPEPMAETLTTRESEVLQMLAQGLKGLLLRSTSASTPSSSISPRFTPNWAPPTALRRSARGRAEV
jgi:DNA-binding NarL/FixJ family response regulator